MTNGPSASCISAARFHAGTIERLIDPILSDIALEYRDALRRGDRWRARWILLLGYVGLFKAMTLHGVGKLTRKLKPDEAGVRMIAASLTAFVVLTFALVLPPLTAIPRMHRTSSGVLALTLVPQALPLAIPVALSIGLGWGWPRDPDGDRVWRRGIVLGIAGALMAAATMQWLVRAANQAFRLTVAAELGMGPTFICICERVQQSKGLSPDRRGFQALTAGGPATARSHQRRL